MGTRDRRWPSWRGTALAVCLALCAPAVAPACDVCAIYMATEQREARTGFHLGLFEQYAHFGTEQLDGSEVTLPATERMDSSITQLLLGYTVGPRLGFQLNLPYVVRDFRRIHDGRIQRGTDDGIGDLSLLGTVRPFSLVTERSLFRVALLAGIKFPTGDADRLGEEAAEPVTPAVARHGVVRHAGDPHGPAPGASSALPAEGGLHGHDLALGSGSWDGIVGGQLFWNRDRLFASVGTQYAIRGTGAFDYRYADDLTWVGGPGIYALLTHEYAVGLQAVVSGETKGKDTQHGRTLDDTAVTALYVGPGVTATWGTSLALDVAVDIPAVQHNTGLQLVPDVRVRGGIDWRF